MSIHQIPVPGATLHCELHGNGPALLLITGGNGDSDAFTGLRDALSHRYTVITFDPRGNSRSPLTGPPVDQSIEQNADDAHRVLTTLVGGPVDVFGSSSGALIALDLVGRYPRLVRTVVPHEPPAVGLLPDAATHHAFFARVRETYRRDGLMPAMHLFVAGTSTSDGSADGEHATGYPAPGAPGRQTGAAGRPVAVAEAAGPAADVMGRIRRNMEFFLEHEVVPFTDYVPDLRALALAPTRVAPAVGADSRAALPALPSFVLADHLGAEVTEFPGDHAGYVGHAPAFAAVLDALLTR